MKTGRPWERPNSKRRIVRRNDASVKEALRHRTAQRVATRITPRIAAPAAPFPCSMRVCGRRLAPGESVLPILRRNIPMVCDPPPGRHQGCPPGGATHPALRVGNPYGRNPMSRMTPVVMALVLSLAGSAFANDGTMLIYDLTELGRGNPVTVSSERSADHGAPELGAAPRMSPTDRTDLTVDWSAGDLELNRRSRSPRSGPGSGMQNTVPQDEPRDGATPTPEPGTLFLMGSGVAAGARFLRRRKATPA